MKLFNIDQQKLYTTNEIAKIMGVSHVTVFNRIKAGKILAEKVGRNYIVKGSDLDEYLNPTNELTEKKKQIIERVVQKVVEDYGEALKKLGKE